VTEKQSLGSRTRARRGLGITLLALVGSGLVLITLALWRCWFHLIVNTPPAAVVLGFVLMVLSGVAQMYRLGARSFLGSGYPLRYPPAWAAGVMGAWICLMCIGTAPSWFNGPPELQADAIGRFAKNIALPLAALYGAVGLVCCNALREPVLLPLTTVASDPLSPADLFRWLADDAPITSPGQDRFGFSAAAQIVAERYRAGLPSQALVGGLGAGKTSFSNLVEAHLLQLGPQQPELLEDLAEHGGLPKFVVREFESTERWTECKFSVPNIMR